MKSFTEIAGMGEFKKKKKPETKKKKDERGKTKVTVSRDDVARTDNKGARKRIIDSPKSKPSFKPPKAKARPERQEKSQSRFRGFVAPPRKVKKEVTPTGDMQTTKVKPIIDQSKRSKSPTKTGDTSVKIIKEDLKNIGRSIKNFQKKLIQSDEAKYKNISDRFKRKNFNRGGMINASFTGEFDDR